MGVADLRSGVPVVLAFGLLGALHQAAVRHVKEKVASIEIPDAARVRFRLKQPWPDFIAFYSSAPPGESSPALGGTRARPCTTWGSVRPVHSWRYTSRAVNGLASRPWASRVASRAAATRAASVTAP